MGKLSEEKVNLLFSYKPEDINRVLIEEKFCNIDDKPAYFNVTDIITLPKNKLGNPSTIETTVGRYIVNLFLFHPIFTNIVGYINKPFDKDVMTSFLDIITEKLLNEEVSTSDMGKLLDRINWMGFSLASYFNTNVTLNSLKPLKKVMKARDELTKKYAKEIKKKDPIILTKIGKDLEKIAREELKGDSGMDMYDSGAAKDFSNTYKNMSIMRGAIKDIDKPGEFHVSLENLMNGIPKEDYYKYADISIDGSYSRGVQTAVGGYLFKKFTMAFQTIVLDEDPNSDCKSKKYIEIILTEFNKRFFNERYILDGNKLTLLNSQNISNYIGKKIKLRSSLFCTAEKICSKCAGMLYHKMKIYNVGLASSKLASLILLQSMKSFHNSTIKTKKIRIFDKIRKI